MKDASSKNETLIGIAILITLVLIAVGVFIKQTRYKSELYTASAPKGEVRIIRVPKADRSSTQKAVPAKGMEPMTPPETFSSDTLSDKIDGKAELYLSAGFQNLETQRLKAADKSDSWVEVYIFDMANMRNAYAVYSIQRRKDAHDLALTKYAYRTENALFFVHGQYYVEMISSSPDMMDEVLAMARDFVQQKPAESGSLGEMAAFPPDRLVEGSISLHASDVFGFNRLNNVFTAKYLMGGEELRAFLSQRESPQEAADLAAGYHRFLVENGGTDAKADLNIPGARVVNVFDLYEVIFSNDRFLAGVHEADNIDSARTLAMTLYNELRKAPR